MVNSGTEATMSAIRARPRAATGRDKHHQVRGLLPRPFADCTSWSRRASGALTLGVPNSPGVPGAVARPEHTMTLPFNDAEATALNACL